jgi:hypothetical protein
MARQLRAAGHSIYLALELLPAGANDDLQLAKATELGAVLITKDLGDFPNLYERWLASGRDHAGIVTCREMEFGQRYRRLEGVARLLTPEAARNHILNLDMFVSEETARQHVIAFAAPAQ